MSNAGTVGNTGGSLKVFRALLRAPSVIALLIANLLPIYGVAALGWDLFSLLIIYWVETGIIGAFAIVNIAMKMGWQALFLVPFFTVHFGGFMLGHLLFLMMLFAAKEGTGFSDIPAILWGTLNNNGLLFVVGGLLVSHAIVFIIYDFIPWWRLVRGGAFNPRDNETGAIIGSAYGRVIMMHVTILFGAILATVFNNQIMFLVLLIALKTSADLWRLLRKPVPPPVIAI